MFNSKERVKTIQATVAMNCGNKLDGRFIIAETSDLQRTMNGQGKFVDFETHDGSRMMLAKAAISAIVQREVPKSTPLEVDNDNNFDPWLVLGVERDTPWHAIKSRFEALERAYHPQRFSVAGIPSEISNYAVEKSKLIAFAYNILKESHSTSEGATAGADVHGEVRDQQFG